MVRREHRVHLLLTASEYETLDALAKLEGTTMVEVMRRALHERSVALGKRRGAVPYVDRACEKCRRVFSARRDLPPPFRCPRHVGKPPQIKAGPLRLVRGKR